MIRQKVDYGKYRYSQKEILKYIGEGAALCGAVDYLFYQTPWVMLLVVPVSVFFLTGKNNYCTTDFEQAADTGLTLIDLGMSDSSFFRNAKDGDFTIINTGSTVYTQEYGDPRWITVSEY